MIARLFDRFAGDRRQLRIRRLCQRLPQEQHVGGEQEVAADRERIVALLLAFFQAGVRQLQHREIAKAELLAEVGEPVLALRRLHQ